MRERNLGCALRQACGISDGSKTCGNGFPMMSHGLAVKVQINKIGSRFLVVPNQVAHQNIEHVIVNRNRLFEARHMERMKEEVKTKKRIRFRYTDKRTALSRVNRRSLVDEKRCVRLGSAHHD
jgi:hypothetical protein